MLAIIILCENFIKMQGVERCVKKIRKIVPYCLQEYTLLEAQPAAVFFFSWQYLYLNSGPVLV
jgi:hypothetical protein